MADIRFPVMETPFEPAMTSVASGSVASIKFPLMFAPRNLPVTQAVWVTASASPHQLPMKQKFHAK